jgi:hypothetical protein
MKPFFLALCGLAALSAAVLAQPAAVRPIKTTGDGASSANGPKVTIVRYRLPLNPATPLSTSPATATAPTSAAPTNAASTSAPVLAAPLVTTQPLTTQAAPGTCSSYGASGSMPPGLLARLGAWFCFRSHGCYPVASATPNCTPGLWRYFVADGAPPSNEEARGAVNPPYRRKVFPVGHFFGAQATGMPGGGVGTVPGCCSR